MYVVCVTIRVEPESLEGFTTPIELTDEQLTDLLQRAIRHGRR